MGAFDKFIGNEGLKAELIRYCDILKNPDKYAALGVTIPAGILLYGDPGLGKTLLAKCFIEESGREAFTIRKDKPDGDFVTHIRETFQKAKDKGNAIVFLDDVDKFANSDCTHPNAEENVTIQSCIDDCADSDVYVIATANDMSLLPDSLVREGRFDIVVEVEYPRDKDVVKIVEYYLSQKKIVLDADAEEIARLCEGHTCAALEGVINQAGIYAGFDGREAINQEDLRRACMRMIFHAPERSEPSDAFTDRVTAIHEAGHAVCAEILKPNCVNVVSINCNSGEMGGFTSIQKERGYALSALAVKNDIIIDLGGKAATEIITGQWDLGCGADISNAFALVEKFIDNFCAYGFDTYERTNNSNLLLEKKDALVASEVNRYYQEAKRILIENRDFLLAIIEELLEKRMLTYKDMAGIRGAIFCT